MSASSFEAFRASLGDAAPPAGVSPALAAMWHEAKGDWPAAHRLAQAQDDADGAWVHAYLHRVEGDLANAAYWYRRAGRAASELPLRDEWTAIVKSLLGSASGASRD
ncbi:MAG TPA: hypothetical protein VFV80_13975 [Geminicoccaceae bacterium]|nr:hypothetical protein [Geminicoccaceae bacterium]